MNKQLELGTTSPKSSAQGIAAQVVANVSLLIAILVYMGWAYEDALLGYFNLSPLDLNVGIVEYMLRSLALFRPTIIIAAVILITVTTVRTWDLDWTKLMRLLAGRAAAHLREGATLRMLISKDKATQRRDGQRALIAVGAVVTATALLFTWIASYVHTNTYILLGMLMTGPLLMSWPTRGHRRGRFPYALAIVVAAACALWAASLYAHNSGIRTAHRIVRDRLALPAVAVYSVQPLALSAPGVTVESLPSGLSYHYRYDGLRLLIARSGTYYLLPVDWSSQLGPTYILDESNSIRIELYSGIEASISTRR